MRLLPKSEVDRLKSVDQKRDIDEGLKLARRIDNLRETAVAEEAALEKFRRETVAKIHEEIVREGKKRDDLKAEVVLLEEKRAEAIKPLDEEWAKVKKESDSVELRRTSVSARETGVSDRERVVAKDREEANALIRKAAVNDAISTTRLTDANRDSEAAAKALIDAQLVLADATTVKRETGKELTHREEVVAQRESNATIKETEISAREKELADRWTLLRDREALLERTIKRTK